MALAVRHADALALELTPLPGLTVHRTTDRALMAALQGRTQEEMVARFADGHRAYVARLHGEAAAWGWAATRTARIGELDATFAVPAGERYLWNFVTLARYRGRGIYPRLLDAIVRTESAEADRFWVAYAPENHASEAGIRKAGFSTVAELSFDAAGRPAVLPAAGGDGEEAASLLGLPGTVGALAPCWRCARAGRLHACASRTCACDYRRPDVGC